MTIHRRLEDRLADFEGTESAVLFGSGYLANAGVIGAIAEAGGIVCSDSLNHASLIDGCKLAGAETFVYDHCDLDHLEWGLAKASGRPAVIVTDSVFSMDGDIAPLEGIVDLARRYGARTVVDEAHGTGVVGPEGRGAVDAAGLNGEVDVVVGTLGKALGSYGAYAACNSEMAEWLTNRARSFVFSTAPPPPAVAGAMEALTILEEDPRRVDKLRANGRAFRNALRANGFDVDDQQTPIIPLIVGSAAAATDLCEEALVQGVYAQAIRPPTVPEGTSRLRLSVMASHKPAELEKAATVLADACLATGLRPAAAPSSRPAAASAPGDDGGRINARRGTSTVFDFEAEALDDFRRAA